jgi:hypothetical protein
MNCFDRIRHEFRTREIIDTVYDSGADVDDLTDAAQAALVRLGEQLLACKHGSPRWAKLEREIRFSNAVLARDYHDFGEANRYLSGYLIEIADDPVAESKTQADFLRSTYRFPFVPESDD